MRGSRRSTLRRMHRWLGLALLAPLLLLAATGILLNHTEGLGLDQRHAGAGWLTRLYGIEPQPPDGGYPVGERWISHARDTVFLDARPIDEMPGPLLGAARLDGVLAVATPRAVSLYTADGRTVDTVELPADAQPATAFAVAGDRAMLSTPGKTYALDEGMTGWTAGSASPGETMRERPLPAALRERITRKLAASTLSWERVLLDLHSGRLFGRLGPWLMDLAGLAVAVLAATGCVMWWRVTRPRRRSRRHRR